MTETLFTLPTDWNEWHAEWTAWQQRHDAHMRRIRSPFQGKNFLADEILGVWKINGRVVELSEMTFPNLSERDERGYLIDKRVRGIGITFEDSATVVHSFTELEEILGL